MSIEDEFKELMKQNFNESFEEHGDPHHVKELGEHCLEDVLRVMAVIAKVAPEITAVDPRLCLTLIMSCISFLIEQNKLKINKEE